MTENKLTKRYEKIIIFVIVVVLLAGYLYIDKIFHAKEPKSSQNENSQAAREIA